MDNQILERLRGGAEEEKRTLTVTQLNEYIKRIIDGNPVLSDVCVKGEISNCKYHSSYLNIK